MKTNPEVRIGTRRSKYRNIRVEIDGERFDSRKEARRWGELQLLQRAGRISNLERQVSYQLAEGYFPPKGRKVPAICYIADHVYTEAGEVVVEDVKSEITRKLPVYRIKRHLMAVVHGIHIREV